MTLGTSLFWITILLLGLFGIRQINKKHKWGLMAKIAGGLILLAILIGLVAWAWIWNSNRPRPINTLGSLSLGMTPLDVSLAVGKPDKESLPGAIDGSRRYLYTNNLNELEYFVRFSVPTSSPAEQAEVICSHDSMYKVFGLGNYSSEDQVKQKLGEPTSQSVRKDGLVKTISYERWMVSFEIEKKNVIGICISSSGIVRYLDEYDLDSQI